MDGKEDKNLNEREKRQEPLWTGKMTITFMVGKRRTKTFMNGRVGKNLYGRERGRCMI